MTLSATDRVVDHIFRLARCGNRGLKSIFHCLTATKTIRDPQPGRWTRRLCRNTAELFIISTACTSFFPPCPLCACGISGRKEHTAGQLCPLFPGASLELPLHPSISLSLSLSLFLLPASLHISSVFLPGSGTDRSGFSPPSLKKKRSSLLVMQSRRRRRSTGIWHVSSNVGSERRSAAFCMQAGLA